MADTIRSVVPADQRAIFRHIVERVEIAGGQVVGIAVRAEAKPFFEDYGTAVVAAPPDGQEGTTVRSRDPLAWYVAAC